MGTTTKHRKLDFVFCDDPEGWDEGDVKEVQERRDICMHMSDTLHCTAGTNTTL